MTTPEPKLHKITAIFSDDEMRNLIAIANRYRASCKDQGMIVPEGDLRALLFCCMHLIGDLQMITTDEERLAMERAGKKPH